MHGSNNELNIVSDVWLLLTRGHGNQVRLKNNRFIEIQ